MKRFVSLDLLRGVAIIAVLFFHMLQVVWNYEGILAAGIPWPYYSIIIPLAFFGQFNVLFVALSGLVNTISIDRQWRRFSTQNPTAEEKNQKANKILKSQLIRGLFIFVMAYTYDVLLNRLLLNTVKQAPDPLLGSLNGLFSTNVLHAIAWGIVISGVLYTQLLRRDKGQQWISKRILIAALLMLLLTPVMITLSRTFPYYYTMGWETRELGWNVLYFFINSLFRGTCPAFPFAVFGVVGALIGFRFSNGNLEKAFANRWFIASIVVFVGGLILYLLRVAKLDVALNAAAGTLPYFFIESVYDVGEKLMLLGGSLLLILILVYAIDIRGKAKEIAKRTISIRRFGLVSLTVFSLQWIVSGFLVAYHNITNAITGATTPFLQGNFSAGWFDFQRAPGLPAMQLVFWFAITLGAWHIFLWLWGKTQFKGSFEWLIVKVMSIGRKDAGERLNMSASLYNVEGVVENPQNYWSQRRLIGMTVLFYIMASIEVGLVAMFL